jgi:hypothetical protein
LLHFFPRPTSWHANNIWKACLQMHLLQLSKPTFPLKSFLFKFDFFKVKIGKKESYAEKKSLLDIEISVFLSLWDLLSYKFLYYVDGNFKILQSI